MNSDLAKENDMTLSQMAREKALDIVFNTRPCLPNDWDVVMVADFNDREGFGDSFVVGDPYCGYSNDYVCSALRSLQRQMYDMAARTLYKVCKLAGTEPANNSSNLTHGE